MKTEILRMLKSTEDYLSGQQLCGMLGVSRTAVWKAVGELKEEGYVIEAVRNRGYRLVEGADVITQAELASMLHTQWIGTRLVYFDETDSDVYKRQLQGRERALDEYQASRGRSMELSRSLRPRGISSLSSTWRRSYKCPVSVSYTHLGQ